MKFAVFHCSGRLQDLGVKNFNQTTHTPLANRRYDLIPRGLFSY